MFTSHHRTLRPGLTGSHSAIAVLSVGIAALGVVPMTNAAPPAEFAPLSVAASAQQLKKLSQSPDLEMAHYVKVNRLSAMHRVAIRWIFHGHDARQ